MPKLVTVLAALVLALSAGPAAAQDAPPPPAPASDAAADDGDATADEAADATADEASDATADEAADVDAPATQPAGERAPATQPAGPATQPAGPATQPAGPATQPAGPATQPAGPATQPAEPDAGAAVTTDTGAAPPVASASVAPDVMERRLVAYVSTGVAAVALGTGITLGTLALTEYNCLNDVLACNETLDEPILGESFLDEKAEVETLSLLADMAYVVAAAATIVAVTGYIRGYFLTDEEPAAEVTP